MISLHTRHTLKFTLGKVANLCHLISGDWTLFLYRSPMFPLQLSWWDTRIMKRCLFLIYDWAEVLTLHFQVFLCLEVLDGRVVYDADDGDAIVLLTDGERQPAGHGVHLVVGQLHPGFPCEKRDRKANRSCHDWKHEKRLFRWGSSPS